MTLFDRLKTDNQRILTEDMAPLTLFNTSGGSKLGRGRYTNPGLNFNPQGQPVASKKWSIAFHIDEFSEITGVNENYESWQGEFVNNQGETIRGIINNPFVDKTLGYVVATLTEIKT
ncbi:hypothetical protein KAR91_68410 [Candidatus Pacearchaeota archaeon]|nr:hypothetical protein [Candidatus Pacearchaeota archaeon]